MPSDSCDLSPLWNMYLGVRSQQYLKNSWHSTPCLRGLVKYMGAEAPSKKTVSSLVCMSYKWIAFARFNRIPLSSSQQQTQLLNMCTSAGSLWPELRILADERLLL